MKQRRIGPFQVSEIGFGCMNLSHGYGDAPSDDVSEKILLKALDLGVTLFDTAALYGFGVNETLVGRVLSPHRNRFTLCSKAVLMPVDGKRALDGRPESIRQSCENSLKRLKTDVIDLFYLHRLDKKVPIEESAGAVADLVRAGKVRTLGVSEMSAATVRRAHAVHPVTAVQTEYSPATRNPEIAVLATCKELGAAFVAFSPVGRGLLTGALRSRANWKPNDMRHGMPRFQEANAAQSEAVVERFEAIARDAGCTPAQLSLAWLLTRGDHVIPIPGTTKLEHLEQNVAASGVSLAPDVIARVDALVVRGEGLAPRYSANTQLEIDTEQF